MLAVVTDILRECKLLDPDDEPGYNITHISEQVLNIGAFAPSGAFFHVKVKECDCFPAEYENYCNAWQAFPQYVPEPLGRYFRNDKEVFVVRGIRHTPVSRGSIARNKQGLVQKNLEFLRATRKAAGAAEAAESHRAFLLQVLARATDPVCAEIVKKWLATERLDGLPYIRQHGDFVVNNLGLTDSGMVIFDWEDYAQVSLPGLDLCTLLVSDASYNANTLCAIIRGAGDEPRHYAELLSRGCEAIGLPPELFRQLIPLYLVIFLDLKRNYGEAIRLTVTEVIHRIQTEVTLA